jgi:hypothetical protein
MSGKKDRQIRRTVKKYVDQKALETLATLRRKPLPTRLKYALKLIF